ncbi:MAG TPA: glycosyltransferase [Candidatus Krumholzibacteria bacterium]|nr:glycosyltransferase [Candidatus Krumholzibacteria bacterium]HPD71317.1 glycosyltransferase [Candidatus Krumholzibacteria bacterium]HRY38983.1 glycosyltransferase [Candidatus Krumholzibacteria bacterium]
MLRVVIVARGFPPSFDSSSRRPWKLAKYLPDCGADVVVVTRVRPADPAAFGIPASVEIVGTAVAAAGAQAARIAPGAPAAARARRALGRWSPVDGNARWSMRAMAVAVRIAAERGAIVWVTSGPPSLLAAALWWHRRTGVEYVADFRDVWTDAPVFARTKAAPARALARRLERAVVRQARCVTTVSGAWLPLFAAKGARACHEVSNGFDPADRPAPAPPAAGRGEPPFVAYAGRLQSGRRDASGLERLLDLLPRDCRLDYFGPDDALLRQVGRAAGPRVRACGLVPFAALLARLQEAAGLVATGGEGDTWESRGAVPAKIYEYMLTERPILYLGKDTDEAARRVVRYPRGFVADPDAPDAGFAERIQAFLRAAGERGPLGAAERADLDRRWGYPQLARRLADLLAEGRPR